MRFSQYLDFFVPSDSNSCISVKYYPILINNASMAKLMYQSSAFKLCINLNFEKLTLKTGFVVQGHI